MTTQRFNTSFIRFLGLVVLVIISPVCFGHNSASASQAPLPQDQQPVTIITGAQAMTNPTAILPPLLPATTPLNLQMPTAVKTTTFTVNPLPQSNQPVKSAVNPNDSSTAANPFRLTNAFASLDGSLRFNYPSAWTGNDVQNEAVVVSHQVAYTILHEQAAHEGTFLVLISGQDSYMPHETGILAEKDLAGAVNEFQLSAMAVSKTEFITVNGHIASLSVATNHQQLALVDVFAVPAQGTYLVSALVLCNPNNLEAAKALAIAILQTAVVS